MENKKTLELVQQLKLNVTNIHSFLLAENKKKKKLAADKDREGKKKLSAERIKKKEQRLEARKEEKGRKIKDKKMKSSGGGILDGILEFGGLLLVGIVVNAADKIKNKLEEFYKDNKAIFDGVGKFLTSVKDAAVGLLDSFTGPYAKEGAFDDIAKFDDSGKLTGGALKKVEEAYAEVDKLILKVDKALGGKQVLAMKNGVEGIKSQRTGTFVPQKFTEKERERYVNQGGKISTSSSTTPVASTPTQQTASTPINDTSPSNRDDDHSVHTPQGGGNYPGFNPGTNPKKIYFHWSGGIGYNGRPTPYHSFVDGSGKVHYNQGYDRDRNGHTWRRNTGSVAIAANAMGHTGQDKGYNEAKGWAQTPLKSIQVNSMTFEAAKLALAWGWKESDINIKNIMTHAEAAANRDGLSPTSNYGPGGEAPIRWDLWYLNKGGAKWSGGKIMRDMIKQHMRNLNRQANNQNGNSIASASASAITPTEPRGNQIASAINQPDPRKRNGSMTIAVQQVNTVQPVPYMVPFPVASKQPSSSPQSQLPAIWSA
jgi:hypothetical protein